MRVVWVIRGDVGAAHAERMDDAVLACARGMYASNSCIPPDDPAADL